MKIHKAEFVRQDERGSLVQLATGLWKQINVLFIKRDNTFGGHFHKEKTELFVVMKGEIQVQITKKKRGRVYHFKAGDSFIIEPLDKHTILAVEDSQMVELITEEYDIGDTYV